MDTSCLWVAQMPTCTCRSPDPAIFVLTDNWLLYPPAHTRGVIINPTWRRLHIAMQIIGGCGLCTNSVPGRRHIARSNHYDLYRVSIHRGSFSISLLVQGNLLLMVGSPNTIENMKESVSTVQWQWNSTTVMDHSTSSQDNDMQSYASQLLPCIYACCFMLVQ